VYGRITKFEYWHNGGYTDAPLTGGFVSAADYYSCSLTKNPFLFQGQRYDEESGLYYMKNRYYDPETGRFITRDPAGDGPNLYAFVNNNPINFVDPMGLDAVSDVEGEIAKLEAERDREIQECQKDLDNIDKGIRDAEAKLGDPTRVLRALGIYAGTEGLMKVSEKGGVRLGIKFMPVVGWAFALADLGNTVYQLKVEDDELMRRIEGYYNARADARTLLVEAEGKYAAKLKLLQAELAAETKRKALIQQLEADLAALNRDLATFTAQFARDCASIESHRYRIYMQYAYPKVEKFMPDVVKIALGEVGGLSSGERREKWMAHKLSLAEDPSAYINDPVNGDHYNYLALGWPGGEMKIIYARDMEMGINAWMETYQRPIRDMKAKIGSVESELGSWKERRWQDITAPTP